MYSLRTSFWIVPEPFRWDTLLLGDKLVQQQEDSGRALMVIEVETSSSGIRRRALACPRSSRSRPRPCQPRRPRSVRPVVAHLSRQVEGDRKPGGAMRDQLAIAGIGFWAVPKPAYCRMVHGLVVYIDGWMPRV